MPFLARMRLAMPLLATPLLAMSLLACPSSPKPPDEQVSLASSLEDAASPAPTPEAFLDALFPLPFLRAALVYEVAGPSELVGTLELLIQRGGYERATWTLHRRATEAETGTNREPSPRPGEGLGTELRLVTVTTPTHAYRERASEPPDLRDSAAAAALAAFTTLSNDDQRRALAGLRSWHKRVLEVSAQATDPVEVVAGQTCVVRQLAEGRLCWWTQARLPLELTSAGWTLRATHVSIDPELTPRAFEVPTADPMGRAPLAAPPVAHSDDAAAAMRDLAQGRPTVWPAQIRSFPVPPVPSAGS